jgi:hypothetical protein
MGLYRDLSSPLSVLTGGLLDLPFWAIMLLGPNLLDWFVMQAVGSARALIALTCLPLVAALYWGLPRKKEYGFFALGALCCVLPLFTTQPQDRLEILATFGGFGLIAGFVSAVAEQVHAPRALRVMRGVFIGLHLVLAPILFIPALASFKLLDDAAGKIASAVPAPAPKHVVLLYSPVEMLIQFACMRTDEDPERKRLETWAELFAGSDALQVRRVDERTLELRPERGWGYGPGERLYSPIADMPRAGTQLHVADMDVTVDESSRDGRPLRVSFRFPTPLEDSERLFLVWQGKHPVPWQPPAVGQSQSFPALSLMNL